MSTDADGFASAADCPANLSAKYEYLDHTADVQLHAWGDSLKEAFEQVVMSMFNYMTDLSKVEAVYTYDVEATGDDMLSLLFNFLDEWLFTFCAEPYFVAKAVQVLEFDEENFTIKSRGWGESFNLSKHSQGTEVKAITYSNMQVHTGKEKDKHEVFVIIDI